MSRVLILAFSIFAFLTYAANAAPMLFNVKAKWFEIDTITTSYEDSKDLLENQPWNVGGFGTGFDFARAVDLAFGDPNKPYAVDNYTPYLFSGPSTFPDFINVVAINTTGIARLDVWRVPRDLELVWLVGKPAIAVPVPAALPLLAGGIGLLGFFGWRRTSKPVMPL